MYNYDKEIARDIEKWLNSFAESESDKWKELYITNHISLYTLLTSLDTIRTLQIRRKIRQAEEENFRLSLDD